MKTALLTLLLCLLAATLSSQEVWTAEIVIDDIYWLNDDEWNGEFHAVLKLEGQVQPSDNFIHNWYTRRDGAGEFYLFDTNGFGPTNHQDEHANHYYEMYVLIEVPDYGVGHSDTIPLAKVGDPEGVSLFPVREDGTALSVAAVDIPIWTEYRWTVPGQAGAGTRFMSTGEYLKVRYNAALGEKFYRGEHNYGQIRYLNYAAYPVEYGPGGGSVTNSIVFRHKRQHDASVRAQLIDDPSSTGAIRFQDPWLEDQAGLGGEFRSQGMSAPFKSVSYNPQNPYNLGVNTTYRGVFWDLDPATGHSRYYSVRAPLTKTITGFPSSFQDWVSTGAALEQVGSNPSGYDQKAVVFTGANATVTARYKSHLASNSSTVLPTNGQRRLVELIFDLNEQDVLYESAGEIWGASRTSGGSFSNEVRVSGGSGSNAAPCLASEYDGTELYGVWRRDLGGGSYAIMYSGRTNGTWSSPLTIATVSGVTPVPVITVKSSAGYTPLYVLYHEGPSTLRTKRSTDGGFTWSNDGGTISVGLGNLSLSPFNADATYKYQMKLAYENNSVISLRDFSTSWGSPGTVPASNNQGYWIEGEAEGYQFSFSTANNPQVLHYGQRTYLAWNQYEEYSSPEWPYSAAVSHKVYQEVDGWGNWSTAVAFLAFDDVQWQQDPSAPALNVLTGERILLEWPFFGTLFRAARVNNSWSVSSDGPGVDAQLSVAAGDPALSTIQMHRETSGALHKLVHSSSFSARVVQDEFAPEPLPLEYSRILSMRDSSTGAFYSVGITEPRVGRQKLAFAPVNDTLPNITAGDFFSFLSTDSYTSVNSLDTVVFDVVTNVGGWGKTSEQVSLSLNLASDIRAGELQTDLRGRSKKLRVRIPVGNNTGKALGLRLTGTLPEQATGVEYQLTHVYRLAKRQSNALAQRQTKPKGQASPTTFELGQNFPNPFNPTAVIPFSLPKSGHVVLKVYTLSGEEISTLVDGEVAAGNHNVTWDGRNNAGQTVATGMYLYRLQSDGLSSVRKMVLAK